MRNGGAKLVKNGHHMKPMLAVLVRYGIGTEDQYDRGRWITKKDLVAIYQGMMADETLLRRHDAGDPIVMGTNIHNYVRYTDFERYLNGEYER